MKYPVASVTPTFLGSPLVTDPSTVSADFAVIGIPRGVPYDTQPEPSAAADSPSAIRERSYRYGAFLDHFDFDSNGSMLPAGLRVVDVGDVVTPRGEHPQSNARATRVIATLLKKGVTPIVLGGDDSTPPFAIAAYENEQPITVVQVDAHIDYRDVVNGERWGYSSPMRRAAEMPWVNQVVHIGARGVGSATLSDVEATRHAGNSIITASAVIASGVAVALEHVPVGGRYYVSIDVDGFDPSVMPGTSAPMPGGLTVSHGIELLQGLQTRGRIVGIGFAEYHPALDVNRITALGIVRLIVCAMAASRLGTLGHR